MKKCAKEECGFIVPLSPARFYRFYVIPVGKRLLERTLKRDKGMIFECNSLFRKTKTLIHRRERDFLNDPK